jgi:hypothetical protein
MAFELYSIDRPQGRCTLGQPIAFDDTPGQRLSAMSKGNLPQPAWLTCIPSKWNLVAKAAGQMDGKATIRPLANGLDSTGC